VLPATGTTATTFQVKWADTADLRGAPIRFDVQVKRPHSSAYVDWQAATTITQANFVPDAGPGTYAFRGRTQSRDFPDAITKWSTNTNVKVAAVSTTTTASTTTTSATTTTTTVSNALQAQVVVHGNQNVNPVGGACDNYGTTAAVLQQLGGPTLTLG